PSVSIRLEVCLSCLTQSPSPHLDPLVARLQAMESPNPNQRLPQSSRTYHSRQTRQKCRQMRSTLHPGATNATSGRRCGSSVESGYRSQPNQAGGLDSCQHSPCINGQLATTLEIDAPALSHSSIYNPDISLSTWRGAVLLHLHCCPP
ncbi:unnamed protein product, partial [Mycena citricolor]